MNRSFQKNSTLVLLLIFTTFSSFAKDRVCSVTRWDRYDKSDFKILEISYSTPAFDDTSAIESWVSKKPQVVAFARHVLFPGNAKRADAVVYLDKMKNSGFCSSYVFEPAASPKDAVEVVIKDSSQINSSAKDEVKISDQPRETRKTVEQPANGNTTSSSSAVQK